MTKRRTSTLEPQPARQPRKQTSAVPDALPASLPDRVTIVADSVVRATCLMAVAVLPLYFSLLTTAGPETDKAVLLVALATIAAGAWLLGTFAHGTRKLPSWHAGPLVWLGIAYFGAYALATALSIHPESSLFGSLTRHQGLLTHAAYIVFFICAATRLRTRDDVEQLISVIIFASIPTVVYGLFQQFGYDPVPTTGDPATLQWPVRSSMGQHVFFGAYLVLVMPLTAARWVSIWERRDQPAARDRGDEPLLALMVTAFAGLSFVGVLAFAKAQPAVFALMPGILAGYGLLGMVVHELPDSASMRRARMVGYGILLALQLLCVLLTSARGPWIGTFAMAAVMAFLVAWWLRRRTVAWGLLGVAAVAALFVLALNAPSGPLQRLRSIHALHRISHLTESGGNDSSAQGRWLIWQGVGTLMSEHPAIGDSWGGIGRDLVGYGPEGMDQAFEAIFPLKLRQLSTEVYTWDRAHNIYLDTLVDAGALGLLALLASVVVFFARMASFLRRRDGWAVPLYIGMVAAVAGHMVEGIFGLETAVSLLLFWLIVGLAAREPVQDDQPRPESTSRVGWMPLAAGYWSVMVVLAGGVALLSPSDHPTLLSVIWVLGIMIGVGAVAWGLLPRLSPAATPRNRRTRAPVVRIARGPRIAAAAISVIALLALLSQWQLERAGMAEAAGFRNLTSGHVQDGMSDLQLSAQLEGDEPKYRYDLANLYIGLASANGQGNQPGYVPGDDDSRTIDPGQASNLGRDQLFMLGVQSLQAARSTTPLTPAAYDALGNAYLEWKHWSQAFDAFQKAEQLSVHNPKYLDGEARALLGLGRSKDALQRATMAVHLDHKYWYSHYALAEAYHQMGQRSRAREEASLGLFWEPIFWPPPPKGLVTQLQKLQRTG